MFVTGYMSIRAEGMGWRRDRSLASNIAITIRSCNPREMHLRERRLPNGLELFFVREAENLR